MVSNEFLHLAGKMGLQLLSGPWAVQQEGSAVNQLLDHVVLSHIGRIVAGHKVSLVDEISRFDLLMAETKVGHGNAAGLLGVIIKICLSIHIGVVADDLDGVLVSAYRTVSAQTPELTVGSSLGSGHQRSAKGKRQMGHIILNTDGELFLLAVLIYSYDLGRSGILGTKAVTSGQDLHAVELAALQGRDNIQVQRLA